MLRGRHCVVIDTHRESPETKVDKRKLREVREVREVKSAIALIMTIILAGEYLTFSNCYLIVIRKMLFCFPVMDELSGIINSIKFNFSTL